MSTLPIILFHNCCKKRFLVPYFLSTIKTQGEPEVITESPNTEEVVAEVVKAIAKAITSAEDVADGFTEISIRIHHKVRNPARARRAIRAIQI